MCMCMRARACTCVSVCAYDLYTRSAHSALGVIRAALRFCCCVSLFFLVGGGVNVKNQ